MPALPLYHLARKACIKNIKSITDVGDIPYELIRPVLIKLENPDQLRELEKASPQLCGADAEIWREFIKRDIPGWEKKPHEPQNPKNWYKVYNKLRTENQAQVNKDAEILKAAMDGLKSERAKHTSRVVDPKTVPRLPRMGGMRVEGGRSRVTSGTSSALIFGSGSKTKALTGKGVLDKARREAREMSLFSARKTLLATPTHKLNDKASQIRNAPQGLLDEHKRPAALSYANPIPKAPTIFAPRRSSATGKTPSAGPAGMTDAERERRLRALTTGSKRDNTGIVLPSTSSSSSSSSTTLRPQNTSSFNAPAARSNGTLDRESSFPSSAYKAPRLKTTPNSDRRSATPSDSTNKKADVGPFMRVKRRKIS